MLPFFSIFHQSAKMQMGLTQKDLDKLKNKTKLIKKKKRTKTRKIASKKNLA